MTVPADVLEQIGYLCIQQHPHRICNGCTSACIEPVFAYPEQPGRLGFGQWRLTESPAT